LHLGLDCEFAVGKFLFSMQRYPTTLGAFVLTEHGDLDMEQANEVLELAVAKGLEEVLLCDVGPDLLSLGIIAEEASGSIFVEGSQGSVSEADSGVVSAVQRRGRSRTSKAETPLVVLIGEEVYPQQ
jgi:hypothetical protein